MARSAGIAVELAPSERVLGPLADALAKSPARTQRVALKILRRQLKSGRSAASKELRKDIPLAKKKIDARISASVISTRAVVGSLKIRGARFELAEYMTPAAIAAQWRRQQRRSGRRAAVALKVKVYKSAGRQAYPDHFVNKGRKSGRWHVMRRADPPDQGSHQIQYGPPITEKFDRIQERFAGEQAAKFEAELVRVLNLKVPL